MAQSMAVSMWSCFGRSTPPSAEDSQHSQTFTRLSRDGRHSQIKPNARRQSTVDGHNTTFTLVQQRPGTTKFRRRTAKMGARA